MDKSATIGWGAALVVAIGAVGNHVWLKADKQRALRDQATAMEQRSVEQQKTIKQLQAQLDAIKADAEQRVRKVQSDAVASQQALQADLDYERLPALPARITFRAEQLGSSDRMLNVTNETSEVFACTVRLQRAGGGEPKVVELKVNPRSFRDLAMLEGWQFRVGDHVEFSKPGYKTLAVDVP